MNLLLPIYIFPPIEYYAFFIEADQILFEANENFQKQTFRNRYYICTPSGKFSLHIPIRHKTGSRLYKDTLISNDYNWQDYHLKSLRTAYRSSPYFEYYEDDLIPLFCEKHKYLMDFNLKAFSLINELLSLDIPLKKTEKYGEKPLFKDMRTFFNTKKETHREFERYTQVFSRTNRFIKNLCILDLFFNQGTNTVTYLKNIKLVI